MSDVAVQAFSNAQEVLSHEVFCKRLSDCLFDSYQMFCAVEAAKGEGFLTEGGNFESLTEQGWVLTEKGREQHAQLRQAVL